MHIKILDTNTKKGKIDINFKRQKNIIFTCDGINKIFLLSEQQVVHFNVKYACGIRKNVFKIKNIFHK